MTAGPYLHCNTAVPKARPCPANRRCSVRKRSKVIDPVGGVRITGDEGGIQRVCAGRAGRQCEWQWAENRWLINCTAC